MKVFKYELELRQIQRIYLPKASQILSVQFQEGTLCLWALVDESAKTDDRTIQIFGTGQSVVSVHPLKYLATVQRDSFVWHVFEEII